MAYNYDKLINKINDVFGTRSAFALQMELSERSVSLKLNNKVGFKQAEIQKAISLLGLSENDIQSYFFTPKVQR